MPPPLKSLLEYDTPSLVSTSKSKGAKDGKAAAKKVRHLQHSSSGCAVQPVLKAERGMGTP